MLGGKPLRLQLLSEDDQAIRAPLPSSRKSWSTAAWPA